MVGRRESTCRAPVPKVRTRGGACAECGKIKDQPEPPKEGSVQAPEGRRRAVVPKEDKDPAVTENWTPTQQAHTRCLHLLGSPPPHEPHTPHPHSGRGEE